MTFQDCVHECLKEPELVSNYDRLYGGHVQSLLKSTGINQEVDLASGFYESEMLKFVDFVNEYVWTRLPIVV